MNIAQLSASQLSQAANIKAQIEKLQEELTSILGTGAPATPAVALGTAVVLATSKKGTISAAGIARIKAAQKARWAKIKAAKATAAKPAIPAKPTPPKKFTMSASAKAAISKAAKARWAKIKAAKKK